MIIYVRKCLAGQVGLNPVECQTSAGLKGQTPLITRWLQKEQQHQHQQQLQPQIPLEAFENFFNLVMPVLKSTEGLMHSANVHFVLLLYCYCITLKSTMGILDFRIYMK